jgi:hypothetical protein
MKQYQRLGMELCLKRVESGLHQRTLSLLLGGVTQFRKCSIPDCVEMPGK